MMKKNHLFRLCFALLALTAFIACSDKEEAPAPNPTIALREVSKSATTLTFSLTTTDAVEAKWLYIEKGSRTVDAEHIFANGTTAEVNKSVEIFVENLQMDTEYEVYAAAKGTEIFVVAEPLPIKTEYAAAEHVVNATVADAVVTDNNFYLTLEDEAAGTSFALDLYAEEGSEYLPGGTYALGEAAPGFASTRYTRYFNGAELDAVSFASGSVDVTATPNDETQEILYAINGTFTYESGDKVIVKYEGVIEGIALPQDYLTFVPDPETQAVFRRPAYSAEKPGEYIIEFTDKDWGALVLDIYADPTLCDNGYDALPEGTYTIADGTVDAYSNVLFYEPEYLSMSFVECTVTVSRSGDDFSFAVDAVCDDENSTRVLMEYTGPVKDMVRVPAVPTITLSEVSKSGTAFTFSLTSTDANEVKWLYIEKGSRTVELAQIFENGTSTDVNTTVEILVENLQMDTEYEVYAAAQGVKDAVMAEPLTIKTEYIATEYFVNATVASADVYDNNFYITLEDSAANTSFALDIYAAVGSAYLPSGTYTLGASEVGFTSSRYTRFKNGSDLDYLGFASGSVDVTATPNEDAGEVSYTINGTFLYESGDKVVLNYEGVIAGIALPEGDAPEGYLTFVPDPDTQAVFRRPAYSAEKPGEYIIEFTDKDWGALILNVYADPTLCDNGYGALPDGTYTIADGTVDTYSNVLFYEPSYMYMNFVGCTVTVSRSGDDFSFTLDAVCDDSNSTKVWMEYTGPVRDMERQK